MYRSSIVSIFRILHILEITKFLFLKQNSVTTKIPYTQKKNALTILCTVQFNKIKNNGWIPLKKKLVEWQRESCWPQKKVKIENSKCMLKCKRYIVAGYTLLMLYTYFYTIEFTVFYLFGHRSISISYSRGLWRKNTTTSQAITYITLSLQVQKWLPLVPVAGD